MDEPQSPKARAPGASSAPSAETARDAGHAQREPASGAVAGGDRALVVGRVDGDGLAILRKRSESAPVEAGIVRPLREGQPIVGEVLKLTPRGDAPQLCDVEVQLDTHALSRGAAKGPAKVATARFREGWDRVFGEAPAKSRPN